jgi:hypothetical protein
MKSASPLRRKLLIAVFLTSVAAWLVAALAIAVYEQWTFHGRTAQELSQRASLLSLNLTAALQFNDREAATEILSTLRDLPEMLSACVYGSSSNLFATFAHDQSETCPQTANSDDAAFAVTSQQARLIQPII